MGRLVAPRLTTPIALAVAIATAILLWDARVLLAPAEDGLRRAMADPPGPARVVIAVVLGGALGLLLARRAPRAARPLLALVLAAAPLVPLVTGRAVILSLFQGPALVLLTASLLGATLAAACAAGRLRWSAPRVRPWPLALVAFAFHAAVLTHLPGPAGAQGDEPHYLVMAQSLLDDGDFDLRDELAARSYAPFYAGTLHAHASPASPPGRIYAVHTPGLPALLALPFAAGGEAGARLFLALLAALAAALTATALRDALGRDDLALAGWAVLTFTPPLPFYAISIYPEVPGALATAVFLMGSGLAFGLSPGSGGTAPLPGAATGPGLLAAVTVAAAALPWIHPRFLPLAGLGLFLTVVRPGLARWQRALPVATFALSVVLLLAWFHATFGRASLSAAYGPGFGDDVALSRAPWGALALLLDRQFGLFAVSPVWLLALPGAVALARHRTGALLRAGLLGASTAAVGASFSMWWGGSCPPARFLVPALPALALMTAPALGARPRLAGGLAGFGLAVLALAMDAPRALHNRGDAQSGLLRHVAPHLDLDGFLPSFVAATEGTALLRLATAALALTIVAGFVLVWRRGWLGAALGAAAWLSVAVGLRGDAPLLDARPATLRMLEAWNPSAWWMPQPFRTPEGLVVQLDLAGAPWTMEPGEIRNSRRLDLPPGLYRFALHGKATFPEPDARTLRTELVSGDVLFAQLDLQQGRPAPSTDVLLPVGARRLQLTASFVQGTSTLDGATLRPIHVLPGPGRDGIEWLRAALPDRYRIPSGRVHTTALDRTPPERGGFHVEGGGRFVVDAPAGTPIELRSDALGFRGTKIVWNGRTIPLSPTADRILLPLVRPSLGRTVVVPAEVLGTAWVSFGEPHIGENGPP